MPTSGPGNRVVGLRHVDESQFAREVASREANPFSDSIAMHSWEYCLRRLSRLQNSPTVSRSGETQEVTRKAAGRFLKGHCKCLVILLLFLPGKASAHVKWFVNADVAAPPRPVGEVLTGQLFVYLFLGSVVAIYGFFLLDRWVLRRRVLAQLDERMKKFDALSIYVMRGSAAMFFLSLSAWHWVHGAGFYLTPELRTNAAWVSWLQLMAGLAALWKRTVVLTGAGVFIFYLAAIRDYGACHLADYLIFLGIGYFLLVSGINRGQWRKSGFIVLFAFMGLTLGWAAIEKFAYPNWAYSLLQARPGMLMGMTPINFMTVSGFVEFNLAFVVLGAASMIGRLATVSLQSVFVLAMFQFGVMDAIGHLLIIAVLFVLYFRGPTGARNMLVLPGKALWTEAYFMTGLYSLAFVLVFLAYYGLHHIYYGV
jgi:hypothetical protein